MIKSLLNKFARFIAKVTAPAPIGIEDYSRKHASDTLKVGTTATVNRTEKAVVGTQTTIMQERILEADEINEQVKDIFARIIALGYKEIPAILSQYHHSVVTAFVLSQYVQLGQYAPELDNLDSKTLDELVVIASELNQLSFEKRMIEQGKAPITPAQITALQSIARVQKLSITIPTNKFDAGRLITKLLENQPAKSPTEMINGITVKQNNKINELCKLMNKFPLTPGNVALASEYIEVLTKEATELGLVTENMATKPQIEYIKRLYASLNKKITKKVQETLDKLTFVKAQELIEKLNAQYQLTPESKIITEGQVDYIIQLSGILNVPVNPTDVKALSKEQATALIDKLSRDYLALLCRGTGTQLSAIDLIKMTPEQVKTMIKQIREENKSKDYKAAQVR